MFETEWSCEGRGELQRRGNRVLARQATQTQTSTPPPPPLPPSLPASWAQRREKVDHRANGTRTPRALSGQAPCARGHARRGATGGVAVGPRGAAAPARLNTLNTPRWTQLLCVRLSRACLAARLSRACLAAPGSCACIPVWRFHTPAIHRLLPGTVGVRTRARGPGLRTAPGPRRRCSSSIAKRELKLDNRACRSLVQQCRFHASWQLQQTSDTSGGLIGFRDGLHALSLGRPSRAPSRTLRPPACRPLPSSQGRHRQPEGAGGPAPCPVVLGRRGGLGGRRAV